MAIFRFFGSKSTTIFRTPRTVTRMNRIPEHSSSAMAQPKDTVPLLISPPRMKLLPMAVDSASGKLAYRPINRVMMPLTSAHITSSADLLITTPFISVI